MLNLRSVGKFRRALDPVPEMEGFDPDTGLAGRDLFLQRVERQWKWCCEKQQPICLLVVNVDHYRSYESMYGEEKCHKSLARVAKAIAEAGRRRADFGGRVRQDEFAVLLADVPQEGAMQVAETIRQKISGTEGISRDAYDTITVSIGVACTVPSSSRFVMSLIHNADQAMRQAKEQGRNKVVLHSDA